MTVAAYTSNYSKLLVPTCIDVSVGMLVQLVLAWEYPYDCDGLY